jgi:hypothetical protein
MIGLVAISAGLALGTYVPGGSPLWGMILGLLQAFFFGLIREPEDLAHHDRVGDTRVPGAQNITPRVDMYGDQIGNWGIAGCAVLYYLNSIVWWSVLVPAVAMVLLLLTMKVRLVIKLWGDR